MSSNGETQFAVKYYSITGKMCLYFAGSPILVCNGNECHNFLFSHFSHEYTDSPVDSNDVYVVIDSFKSKIIRVKVGHS